MTDAHTMTLIQRLALYRVHYEDCDKVLSDRDDALCDCTAYEDVEAVIEALLS